MFRTGKAGYIRYRSLFELVAGYIIYWNLFITDSAGYELIYIQTTDAALIEDVERQARRLATDVDNVVENLACILQSISALTVETVETYR